MPNKPCYVLMLALVPVCSALGECNNAIPRTTPDQAFSIHDDGTVTHNITGLMWMRCLLGQTWTGTTCSGNAQVYNWAAALYAAEAFSFADYNDWRLPNKNELASLVERACYKPAINTTAFPNAYAEGKVSSPNWSSSENPNFSHTAWYVLFDSGTVGVSSYMAGEFFVRLVRGGQ